MKIKQLKGAYRTCIPLPIYGYRIHVVFTKEFEKDFEIIKKEFNSKSTWKPSCTVKAFHYKVIDKPDAVIFYNPDTDVDTIVHEAYHGVYNMMKWIDAEHEEEVYAYTLGYLVNLLIGDQEKAKKFFEKGLDKPEEVG